MDNLGLGAVKALLCFQLMSMVNNGNGLNSVLQKGCGKREHHQVASGLLSLVIS